MKIYFLFLYTRNVADELRDTLKFKYFFYIAVSDSEILAVSLEMYWEHWKCIVCILHKKKL